MRAPRHLLGMIAVVTGLAPAATGCDSGGGHPSETAPAVAAAPAGPDRRPAIASVLSTRAGSDPQVKVDLVGLNRFGSRHVVVQLRVANSGDDTLNVGEQLKDEGSDEDGSVPDGIALIDTAARRLLEPYRRADGKGCLCTPEKEDFGGYVDPGESRTWFAVLPAPSGHPRTTTVYTPLARPFVNVPISDAPPTAPPGDAIPSPDATPVKTIARPIDARADALDRTAEIHDSGDEIQVSLSSDVLFRLGRTALTPRADALLRRAAARIDASPGRTVRIEGHADSSGTDAINDPLSARRADTVRARLSALVTRRGVTYEVKGYGSHRPLWSNETEEGRRRNRRVTVVFQRPPENRPTAGATAPAARPGPVTAKDEDGNAFSARVTGLRALGGGYGALTYEITNTGGAEAEVPGLSFDEEWMQLKYWATANVALVDRAAAMRYPAARYLLGTGSRSALCLCPGTAGIRLGMASLLPDEKKEFWAIVKLPPDAAAVDVALASFPPITGVPIT